MGSGIRTFAIDRGYRIEAVLRVRAGKAVSSTLRAARLLIATRGWALFATRKQPALSGGPVDVVTAIRIAFGGNPSATLELMDYYALLAPIASVVGSSFATWERQPDNEVATVLAMLDDAIAFAVQAEDASPEILAAVRVALSGVN